MAKSALPGVLLILAGALVTYWSLTKLGLFVAKTGPGSGQGAGAA